MKQILLTTAAIFLIQLGFAQYDVSATEGKEKFDGIGSKNAIVVRIYDNTAEEILKEWKRKMRWQHFAKIEATGLQLFADDAKIKEVSSNTMDIYAKPVRHADGYTEFRTAADLGGAFLSSKQHPDMYKAMKNYLEKFARETTRTGLQERIEKEENTLTDLKKTKTGYRDEITDFKNEIAELERQIKQLKEKIAANNRLIKAKDSEISKQEAELQRLRSITIQ